MSKIKGCSFMRGRYNRRPLGVSAMKMNNTAKTIADFNEYSNENLTEPQSVTFSHIVLSARRCIPVAVITIRNPNVNATAIAHHWQGNLNRFIQAHNPMPAISGAESPSWNQPAMNAANMLQTSCHLCIGDSAALLRVRIVNNIKNAE